MSEVLYENGFPVYAIVNGKMVMVQEVRHGRWVVLGEQIEKQTFDECKCSECGCVEYFNKGWKRFNYCPNCGARMDLEEK